MNGGSYHAPKVSVILKDWLEHTLAQVAAKSGLGKAIRYALGNWPALVRYCEDGRIEIDKRKNPAFWRRGFW